MRGKPENPVPIDNRDCIFFNECPDCGGVGWFLIDETKPQQASANICQCETCARCASYWEEYNCLPSDIQADLPNFCGRHLRERDEDGDCFDCLKEIGVGKET